MKLSHGVAAGAEDTKYQAKYKDLKKKVKELEADNDRLHFKVLEARKNVTRMKLERAVLYERLCAVPPTDEETRRGMLDPPITTPQVHPPSSAQPRLDQADSRDPNVMEYIRIHSRPGGRTGAVEVSTPNLSRGPPLPPLVHDHFEHSRSHSQGSNSYPAHVSSSRPSRPRGYDGPVLHNYPDDPPHLDTFPHGNRRLEIHELDSHRGPHIPSHNDRDLELENRVLPPMERPTPNRVPTPPFAQRSYSNTSRRDSEPRRTSADREAPHELLGPGLHPSRSNTPASARGSGSAPSRPQSRTQGYERERELPRSSFAAPPILAPEEHDDEMQVEDGPDARKRMRDEYEGSASASAAYLPDERTSKKSHQDDAGSVNGDGAKDVAMEAEDS